jgi:RHS repeat-associated protein
VTEKPAGAPAAPAAALPPSLSLPKGGGAIRGIGEKFAANPATGTGTMSVPIAVSPGRSGFHPDLFLSYDSGAGNGPFGFGWTLAVAAITRKTDKGLPRYEDAAESDVFILSGSEDLVPVYRQDPDGSWVAAHPGHRRDPEGFWVHDPSGRLLVHEDELEGYRVRRYRPRVEGAFYRIERWSSTASPGDVHWRSISKDNILAVYGLDARSRVADPTDAARIFSWLLCETRDDKGNAILYRYRSEDGVGLDLSRAHESNRGARDDSRRRTNRYLKRVLYGNRDPLLDGRGRRPRVLDQAQVDAQIAAGRWMFELVLDYGDHDRDTPAPNDDGALDAQGRTRYPWSARADAFSSYRAGFEVRTSRLCRRVLMFHHFGGEPGVGRDCLVRSTDFTYSADADPADVRNPVYAFLNAVTQSGYRRIAGGYERRSFPPVEFEYSEPAVQEIVEEVDPSSLENLPTGVGGDYRWVDLDGQGVAGILTQQGGTWFYKRNLSPIPVTLPDGQQSIQARFAPLEAVPLAPSMGFEDGAEIMDLTGDGRPDVVVMEGPVPGFFEHDEPQGWKPFRPFASGLTGSWRDPNLRLVDLDGDGHADVLITEDDALVWHESLEEEGFGPARRVAKAVDEEKGPRVVFADTSQSIQLADLSGDGMSDIVRIRNGEACYWPNLGHGRFGAKVAMDNAPHFDNPDQFDPGRIRLADIDGSGTTDVIYLHADGVRLFFNQSGNEWGAPVDLKVSLEVDEAASVTVADLLGNGTACLVWSSPLPAHDRRAMRYVNLIGDRKPHLLVGTVNNLGAETRVDYAPSTRWYLQDERDGRPWVARLPFPVHVVERVTTYDHISRNRFVTRYAYHHGCYDGDDREFRGFGMIEQWDSEELGTLAAGAVAGEETVMAASHVAPVHTKTWFHTGVYAGRDHVSDHHAREYFREPGTTDAQAQALLLSDTTLPPGLTLEEEREACRAFKGSMLRQEVYADDAGLGASAAAIARARVPYTVTEQNFGVRRLQPKGANRHAVVHTHSAEAITYHYERVANDPRIEHALTLEVDPYGNVLKRALVAYGRRTQVRVVDDGGRVQQVPNPGQAALAAGDRAKQTTPLLVYSEYLFTNAVDTTHARRTPLECENASFELTGYPASGPGGRYTPDDLVEPDPAAPVGAKRLRLRFTDEVAYEAAATSNRCRRPIECLRTLYRRDDLSALLPLGVLHELALPGEGYRLAFTPGLLKQVFQRPQTGGGSEALIADPASVLGSKGGAQGGYIRSQTLKSDGRFPAGGPGDHWWMPSGRSFFSDDPAAGAAGELAQARSHFFLTRRYRDPFDHDTSVDFDAHDLLISETRDPVGNRMAVGVNDYRVLQPRLLVDPNRNRTEVAFDALGRVEAVALIGKEAPAPTEGDTLSGFSPGLSDAQLQGLFDGSDLASGAAALLQGATTRFVYDLDRFQRTRRAAPNDRTRWRPPCAASLTRETHVADAPPPHGLRIQLSFSYSDGFGREIQKKLQADPGPLVPGGGAVPHRWVTSGWTIFNNKGKPVRQYEPFFSQTQRFEYGVAVGVSPVVFYDPVGRAVVTLHPNHSYEKVVFDSWGQTTYDANDTCAARGGETGDPRTDPHIRGVVERFFAAQPPSPTPWKTWHQQRIDGSRGPHERAAAVRAAAHADTPTTSHLDVVGRCFLSVSRNRVVCAGHDLDGTQETISTRTEIDIEGNQREVRDGLQQAGDPLGRVVMRYAYDMLGNRIYQLSMEAGARWTVHDAQGNAIRSWDDRGHNLVKSYDALRRPVSETVRGTIASGDRASDPRTLGRDVMVSKVEYGEPPAGASAADEDRARRLNLRARIFRSFDASGEATNARLDAAGDAVEAYDFKGNLLYSTRRFARNYKDLPDWLLDPPLESETFESSSRYDAMNRVVQAVLPHSSLGHAKRHVIQPAFDEGGLLRRVDVWLERTSEPAQLLDPAVDAPSAAGVGDMDHDAKGQQLFVRLKNGATTRYAYDAETFRLVRLNTTRGPSFTEDCDNEHPPPSTIAAPDEPPHAPSCGLQNLRYVYDPSGNVTHVQDDARQAIYFRNQRVEPSNDYTYDALYRLIEATGREHLGQQADGSRNAPAVPDAAGTFHIRHDHPNTLQAMGSYVERYVYDLVGNILQLQHRGSDPVHPGWTRAYTYNETSLVEDGSGGPAKTSNRLTQTASPNAGVPPSAEAYQHDRHGNMVRMPHLGGGAPGPNLHWDYADRLRRVEFGGGGIAYYVYDATGARVRKVWEKAPGLTEERIYAGEFEVFRQHSGPVDPANVRLERETLHVMDETKRVAQVELRTVDASGTDPAPAKLVRYQVGNHLGSVSLELDDAAHIVSYEEFAPYGSSTYQAVRNQTETPKRYRFTGKERDEETGFALHGARYYASWLGRWCSADPAGVVDGPNLYRYARGDPVGLVDPDGHQAAEVLRPETIAVAGTALMRAAQAWGTASVITGGTGVAVASGAPAAGGAVVGVGAAGTAASMPAVAVGALAAGQVALAVGMALLTNLWMQRSGSIARYGNPYGVPRSDFFPVIREARRLRTEPFPIPEPAPEPAPDEERQRIRRRPGRIYVTYTKYNSRTGRYYSGRTSAVIDLNLPWRPQALAAVRARDANHHVDEDQEPTDPGFEAAVLDQFAVGYAVDYNERYRDLGYIAIRGREQQSIDMHGRRRAQQLGHDLRSFRGGAQSDTNPGTSLTENPIRGVAKDNPLGEVFHNAANLVFNEELAPFTGNRIRPPARTP